MSTYRQSLKDYAKDHGLSHQEVMNLVHNGKLEGLEEDGTFYVRFETKQKGQEANRLQTKMSFMGWALSGGIYFNGDVPGSFFGGAGMGFFAVGAFPVFRDMLSSSASAAEKLFPIFLLTCVLGIVCMTIGYNKYSRTVYK